jgi:phycoerythrin-associated linker protein
MLELWPVRSSEDLQVVIRAVYKQVLGNPHVMESERLVAAESQLCNGDISVREFVRAVAKSDFYRSRYFEACAPYRFVELNFSHLLGRAPQDQREVSLHIVRCVAEGYDAEIDSYIDSDEYLTAFGENNVPCSRGKSSAGNATQIGFNRIFALDRGPAQLDSAIKPSTNTVIGSGTEKRLRILVSGGKGNTRHINTREYLVSASKMSSQIQYIHRTGSKILSITEA